MIKGRRRYREDCTYLVLDQLLLSSDDVPKLILIYPTEIARLEPPVRGDARVGCGLVV